MYQECDRMRRNNQSIVFLNSKILDTQNDKIKYKMKFVDQKFYLLILRVKFNDFFQEILCTWAAFIIRQFQNPFTVILFSSCQPQTITNLISDTVDFLLLDIFYKWNHKICNIFCLASFIQINVLLGLSRLQHIVFYFFVLLKNILLFSYTTFSYPFKSQ